MRLDDGRDPLTIAYDKRRDAERAKRQREADGHRQCQVIPVTGQMSGQRYYVVFGYPKE